MRKVLDPSRTWDICRGCVDQKACSVCGKKNIDEDKPMDVCNPCIKKRQMDFRADLPALLARRAATGAH
jgi:hypothetical protein